MPTHPLYLSTALMNRSYLVSCKCHKFRWLSLCHSLFYCHLLPKKLARDYHYYIKITRSGQTRKDIKLQKILIENSSDVFVTTPMTHWIFLSNCNIAFIIFFFIKREEQNALVKLEQMNGIPHPIYIKSSLNDKFQFSNAIEFPLRSQHALDSKAKHRFPWKTKNATHKSTQRCKPLHIQSNQSWKKLTLTAKSEAAGSQSQQPTALISPVLRRQIQVYTNRILEEYGVPEKNFSREKGIAQ